MLVILVTWEGEVRRIMVPSQPGQTQFLKSHLNGKSWVCWCVPVIPATVGRKHKQEDGIPGWPGQKTRPYLQDNQSIKGWRCGSSERAPT
jgi:hypothetical protein